MDGRPECAPPIVHMRIAPPTEHPVPAWQITPWLQIHGITCHPASRVEFFSSLLKGFGGGRRAAEERLAECLGEHVVEIEMQLAEEAYAGAAFAGDRDGRFQSDLKV